MNVLSLFSGCGGMDIGFEGGFTCFRRSINSEIHPDWIKTGNGKVVEVAETGFQTVFANDIRSDAKTAWTSYFTKKNGCPESVYRVESIVELVKRERGGEKVFPENISIVTGGFPCQDFSVAGKRKGFDSEKSHDGGKRAAGEPSEESRGQLYMWMREVVTLTEPNLFVAENVKGLINLEDVKEIIESDFSKAANGGYLVVPGRVLHAADYGVPQSRERVIFFGFKRSALTKEAQKALSQSTIPTEYDPYPPKTHAFTVKDGSLPPPLTCREALEGLAEPEFSSDASQRSVSKAKFMGKHCQGQKEIKLDSIGPTIRSEHHGNIEYRRLSEEHGGLYLEELASGLKERRLSVRECARIQTFPDDYQFIHPKTGSMAGVSSNGAYKIIGNAVPCVLAYNVAKHLAEMWPVYFGEDLQ